MYSTSTLSPVPLRLLTAEISYLCLNGRRKLTSNVSLCFLSALKYTVASHSRGTTWDKKGKKEQNQDKRNRDSAEIEVEERLHAVVAMSRKDVNKKDVQIDKQLLR